MSSHVKPFFAETSKARAASRSHGLGRATTEPVIRHAIGKTATIAPSGQDPTAKHSAPAVVSTQTDTLAAFSGASEGLDLSQHGTDQGIAPPDPVIAASPSDVVEAVNSTIDVFSRAGALLGTDDINTFVSVDPAHFVSDPRIVYDASSQRWWFTVTEAPDSFSCSSFVSPVLLAVSASSNPLPFSSWNVYALPFVAASALLGDQPGLGISNNTLAMTWNDFDCGGNFLGSEIDILQKTDLEHGTGTHADEEFTDTSFAPQPVQSFGSTTTQYVVVNDSDCAPSICSQPVIEVDAFTGTPEGAGGVTVTSSFPSMTPTLVDPANNFGLPPAQQKGTTTTLNTDDDRFLNAVWENGVIWTAGGTECTPSGDTAPRSCLDFVGVTASSTGVVNPTITQINSVGVSGSYLYYPAVSVDSSGNMFTVFNESSSTTFPTIMSATIPAGGAALSAFQLVHTSSGFYDPPSGACSSIASTNACRWGDYAGAAQDPSNPEDVWVVSEAEDGTTPGCASASLCWGTDVALLTLAPPTITALTPASGPVAGGQTVTVSGLDFGTDTTATFGGSTIAISNLTPKSFTFVTAPSALTGATDLVQATDALGTTAALTYTYVGLANYAPVSPIRILDTRSGAGSPLGPGTIRTLTVPTTVVPNTASAVVLNMTEVNGTAASLLTVYPFGTTKPNASNLNFLAHTVIANLVTVTLGPGGKVNIYNALGSVNVLADVEGYFTPQPATDFQGLFHPISPVRVCDTRSHSPTAVCSAHGVLGQTAMAVNVTGIGAAPIPSDGTAGAAVLNITGVAGTAGTFLSVFPTNSSGGCTYTGTHAPPFSTLNLLAGAVQANRVMVELGPAFTGGPTTSVCVFNAVGTINVILDANGWYGSATATATPTGYQYQAVAPSRVCDTRVGSATCLKAVIGAAVSRLIGIAGVGGVPPTGGATTVVAVIANLTAVVPTAGTYLTIYPANLTSTPTASDLNVNAGVTLPNLAVVQLDTTGGAHDGDVYLYNSVGSVNAIIDIEGWFQ